MKIVITDDARADLESIGLYIAQSNPDRALSLVEDLERRCESLGSLSERFSLVPRYEKSGVRHLVHGNYLIFYRVDPDCVVILHVLHGAADYEALLFPPDSDHP